MARALRSTVGRDQYGTNASNLASDVLTVQQLLNQVPPTAGGSPIPVPQSGVFDQATFLAICRFQQRQFHWADGLVQPGERTLVALNTFDTLVPGPRLNFIIPSDHMAERAGIVAAARSLPRTIHANRLGDREEGTGKVLRTGWAEIVRIFQLAAPVFNRDVAHQKYFTGPVGHTVQIVKPDGKRVDQLVSLPHWCGIFALWAIKQSGLKVGTWIVSRSLADVAGIRRLQKDQFPGVGDVAILKGKNVHHVVITEIIPDVDRDTSYDVRTIEGNSGLDSEITDGFHSHDEFVSVHSAF
jgi:hypothetical protein